MNRTRNRIPNILTSPKKIRLQKIPGAKPDTERERKKVKEKERESPIHIVMDRAVMVSIRPPSISSAAPVVAHPCCITQEGERYESTNNWQNKCWGKGSKRKQFYYHYSDVAPASELASGQREKCAPAFLV